MLLYKLAVELQLSTMADNQFMQLYRLLLMSNFIHHQVIEQQAK